MARAPRRTSGRWPAKSSLRRAPPGCPARHARERPDPDRRRRVGRQLRHLDDAAADVAVPVSVEEVEHQPEHRPARRTAASIPRSGSRTGGCSRRSTAARRRTPPACGTAEAGSGPAAQDHHAQRHRRKRKQRARVRIVGERADRQEGRRDRHDDAGDDGDDLGRAELRVNGATASPAAGRRAP